MTTAAAPARLSLDQLRALPKAERDAYFAARKAVEDAARAERQAEADAAAAARYTDETLTAALTKTGAPGIVAEAEILLTVPEALRRDVVTEAHYLGNVLPGYRWSDALYEARTHILAGRPTSPSLLAR